MKKLILIVAMATSSVSAQQLDHTLTDDDEVLFNYVEEILSTVINAVSSIITHFNGAGGCGADDNPCPFQPLQPFSLHWGVENVQGCTGTNTANHPSFMGVLEPTSGGTGEYSKTIVGGLDPNVTLPVVFTITCDPVVTFKNYEFKFLAQETSSIIIPDDVYIMARVIKGETFLIHLVENENFKNADMEMTRDFQSLGDKKWYSELYVKDRLDGGSYNINVNHSNIVKAYDYDKIWYVVTEYDPRISDLGESYEVGKCDMLAYQPAINFSTHTILKADLKNECILEPDTEYFITKVYFQDV